VTTAGGKLTLSSYVDKLFSIRDWPMGAVWIQEDFEEHLKSKRGLEIKPSSRSMLVPRGCKQDLPDPMKWPRHAVMDCLGFQAQDHAETDSAWSTTRNLMRRAFFCQLLQN